MDSLDIQKLEARVTELETHVEALADLVSKFALALLGKVLSQLKEDSEESLHSMDEDDFDDSEETNEREIL